MKQLLVFLLVVGGLLVVVTALRVPLLFLLLASRTRPRRPFGSLPTPEPPDYADPASWAVHPERLGKSLLTPEGTEPGALSSSPPADVFFIHPTTFFGRGTWNSPIEDAKAREMVDEVVVPAEASVFNACCRIFAPRYRQATFYTFLGAWESGRQALELAFEDVARAFRHYLEHWNDGRPFFVASHSQGSTHAIRLLEEAVQGSGAMSRMVAAYVVGYALPLDKFATSLSRFHPCDGPHDVGCVIAWDTYAENGGPAHRFDRAEHWYPTPDGTGRWERRSGKTPLCVNPLTWRRDTETASRELNVGAVYVVFSTSTFGLKMLTSSEPLGLEALGLSSPLEHEVSAQCREDGYLYISQPQAPALKLAVMPGGNFHNYDYSLFYMNIRRNVEERLTRFLEIEAGG